VVEARHSRRSLKRLPDRLGLAGTAGFKRTFEGHLAIAHEVVDDE
jgi:hypothetical protein